MKKVISLALACVALLGLENAEAAATPVEKLEINGDLRFMYGDFKFKSANGSREKRYIQRSDVKLDAKYSFDKNNKIDVGICDIRTYNDRQYERRAYVHRANFSSDNEKYGYTIGRMGHIGLDNNIVYCDFNYLDGAKLRLGPKNSYVEVFAGAVGKGQDRQRGYYVKGIKEWKHWEARTAYFNFDKKENTTSFNHQKIWSNSVTYKFNKNFSIEYERLNFAGQNYGGKASSQSGYVAGLTWTNLDLTKPNTFYGYLGYFHQPQGSFLGQHHNIIAPVEFFDWSGAGLEAMGFKGPGVYLGYTLAKGVLLNFEAYRFKNIYGGKDNLKHTTVGAYLDVFF